MMTDLSELVGAKDGSTRVCLRYTSGVESDNANCFVFLQAMDRLGKSPKDLRDEPPKKPAHLTDSDWSEVQRVLATFP